MTYIFYNAKRWVKDNKKGYYHAHFGKTTKLLHRQVWEDNYGEIPKGYHIHHIDENKDNNTIDNLELLNMHEHLRNHFLNNVKKGILNPDESLEKARVKAKEWHSSEEGKKWHSIHAKEIANKIPYVTKKCEYCGNEYKVKKSHAYESKFCSNKCKSASRRHSSIVTGKQIGRAHV